MKKIIVFSAMLFIIFSVFAMPSPKLSSSVSVSDCISLEGADINGDGLLSYAEILTVCPTFPVLLFNAADTNGDGLLDQDEVDVACKAGLFYGC
ncbi:hypothetical protein [Flavivirga jejuensis]|uniref:EF-hand domain-containing protein n=1 Tax=Flavivirga jejuensis TaxID=870487 RepID=A0ABT8WKR8_9FLAO|nr:hypothetical protein [Flavivirga jejuensis]MDO5973713.1 hypothetical protein [Flavivirga jejuensis]